MHPPFRKVRRCQRRPRSQVGAVFALHLCLRLRERPAILQIAGQRESITHAINKNYPFWKLFVNGSNVEKLGLIVRELFLHSLHTLQNLIRKYAR